MAPAVYHCFRRTPEGVPSVLNNAFATMLSLQCALIVAHDLVDIPGWNHGSQVRAAIGGRKFWAATLINAIFPGIALYFAIHYWRQPAPYPVAIYWVLYCAITVISALAMWWVPYFFGADDKTKRLYAQMYAGTRQVLPPRGDNPCPNALHIVFHVLFVSNLMMALLLWLRA